MPTISIIVPVYKVEQYIHLCIDSILNQTFTDFELILVDDGSPDKCGKICDEYAEIDNRIRVLHQQNGGLSNARNNGIKIAKGKYVAFVDSDDMISTEYCQVLLDLLNETEYDFSVCGIHRFNDGYFYPPANSDTKISIYNNIELLHMQIHKQSEFGACNKLYRKEIFDLLSFADGKLNEDVIFSADLASNLKNSVICTNQELYFYRKREGSIVSNQSIKGSTDFIYAGKHLINSAKNNYCNLYNDCVEYAIKYPWLFIDKIIVNRQIGTNKDFLNNLQSLINDNLQAILSSDNIDSILKFRMNLFAKSKFLYYINAYTRLLRVYLFKIIKKDPYKDGHGI